MKKSGILLALIISAGLFTTAAARRNNSDGRAIKNGFGVNLVVGVPSANFGANVDYTINSSAQYAALLGLQLGNRWYIAPQEQYGFGIMVNWFDATVASTTFSDSYTRTVSKNVLTTNSDYSRMTSDISLCAFGPIGTFAINEDMAVDAYYNLRPTILVSWNDETKTTTPVSIDNPEFNHSDGYVGVGISHAIGTAFRWKVLSVGVDYVFGSINCTHFGTDPITSTNINANTFVYADQKLSTNSLRFHLGVKF